MRSIFVLPFVLACSAPDGGGSTTMSTASENVDESGAAIAFAKSQIEQRGLRTVWSTPLVFDKARAVHLHDRVWVVDVPESGHDASGRVIPLGLPLGIGVEVDLDAKTCRQMMLE
ncbi:MAG TPA: hypothetical protein VH054_00065 [Polyangiaceae bacterium]|jgi:hypothetical protein|nr:hypothetical protein [Polyangiaceae bacterium]